MLADDEVLLGGLAEGGGGVLQVAERRALTIIDPTETQVPTDGAATTPQVFLPPHNVHV
jgi:hypothetical protein